MPLTGALCTYQWHPPLPHPRVGWGNSGDLTEYHVKNPSPVLWCYQMSIHLSIAKNILGYVYSPCQFPLPLGGTTVGGKLLSITGQFLLYSTGVGVVRVLLTGA